MSDDAKSAGPSAPSISPGDSLLQYLAVGRLASNKEGTLLPEKHRLVAHNFARKDDPDPEYAKLIKSHLKAVLKRAGHKLSPGKRIRLKDDSSRYEVHILTEEAEEDKMKTLVFFGQRRGECAPWLRVSHLELASTHLNTPVHAAAVPLLFASSAVTALEFPKYHSVAGLLKDVKQGFFSSVDSSTLWQGGSVQRECQHYFARLSLHYASSPLLKVEAKTEAVREVMASSVARALSSVETLEDMDEKAEVFEDKSKTFFKRTEAVKVQERSKYRKLTILLVLGVLAVVGYLVYTAIKKYTNILGTEVGDASSSSSSSSSTGMDDSSSSTGDAGADTAAADPATAAAEPSATPSAIALRQTRGGSFSSVYSSGDSSSSSDALLPSSSSSSSNRRSTPLQQLRRDIQKLSAASMLPQ